MTVARKRRVAPRAASVTTMAHHDAADAAARAVLSGMILDPASTRRARALLEPEAFRLTSHQRIFEALLALDDRGVGADLVTVVDELRRRGWLESVGGPVALTQLFESGTTTANLPSHAQIVAEDAWRRGTSRFLKEALERVDDPTISNADINAYLQTMPARAAQLHASPANPREGQPALQGTSLDLRDPEPWPEPVDGATLLDEIARVIGRFVVIPKRDADAAALWVLMTYCMAYVEAAVRLILTSPTRECGKTRLLTVLSTMVLRPLPASSITSAALFRVVEARRPTVLVDEADNARLNENDELRALLNSGHTRGAASVVRTVGDQHEPRAFSTWCAVALAAIGRLPDTVASRGIVLGLQRKPRGVRVERLRERQLRAELESVRRKALRWSADHGQQLADADPHLPLSLDGRAADNWAVLAAIADAAGGVWPDKARQAALILSGEAEEQEGAAGPMLLADLRDLFAERGNRLASEDIVNALARMEGRPWPEWNGGKSITTRGLARLLKPFGIEPDSVRFGDDTRKGYLLDWFLDAFARYLPVHPEHPEQPAIAAAPTLTSYPEHVQRVPDLDSDLDPHESSSVPDVPDADSESVDLAERDDRALAAPPVVEFAAVTDGGPF